MSETFRTAPLHDAPVPVMIAGIAILATRTLGVAMLFHELGFQEIASFVHRSAQAWDSTLIFIASQLLFCIELRCAFMLMRGANRGRWGYALTQAIVLSYMVVASLGWVYPEIFSISGENDAEIVHRVLLQKLPDLLVLILLFVPVSSRQYFRH